MFDHALDYIIAHGLLETLSVGIIPSVLLLAALILILKLIEMNRTAKSRVFQAIGRNAIKEKKKVENKKLKERYEAMQDRIAAEGKVNHLRTRIARLKAADEERRNRYGRE